MKATIPGYYTYPSAESPRKWADCGTVERQAIKHYFQEVKLDNRPYVYVRSCKLSTPKEIMQAISLGLIVAPAVRNPLVDSSPRRYLAFGQKAVRHPLWAPFWVTLAIVEIIFILACVLNTRTIIQASFVDPIGDIKLKVAKELQPVKAEAKVLAAATADKDQMIEKMITHIHKMESSSGRNTNANALHNLCKAKGQSNEYGFGGMAHKWCYADDAQAQSVVRASLSKRWEAMNGDVKMILCYYNLGLKVSTCPYVEDF